MSVDLSTLDTIAASEKGASCELLHPGTKAPLDITITVAGIDSTLYRKQQMRVQNARLKGFRGAGAGKLTAEEMEAENLALLASCTLSWDGMTENTAVLECDAATAKRVYKEYPWIRDQVDAFMGDRANFLPE